MVTPIERDELAARIADGTIVVLDAQAPGWYEREHLPGALGIPYDEIDSTVARAVPDKDIEIAVYCWNETCLGSAVVAERLCELGYTQIRRYVGGKQDWSDAGLPLDAISACATAKRRLP